MIHNFRSANHLSSGTNQGKLGRRGQKKDLFHFWEGEFLRPPSKKLYTHRGFFGSSLSISTTNHANTFGPSRCIALSHSFQTIFHIAKILRAEKRRIR